jgi:CRISPR-associated protein Csb3
MFEARSEADLNLHSLLSALRAAQFECLEHPDVAVKPIQLKLGHGNLLLDWWFDDFRTKTASIKCWAGQVTTRKLMAELLPAIDPTTTADRLFTQPSMMTTRFGVDPRSAWNTLDLGFSPDKHNQDAATYPIVEILGAIGLQGFRPNSDDRSLVSYSLWTSLLPRVPARRAATMRWPGLRCATYKFSIEKRGSYKFFTFAASGRKD